MQVPSQASAVESPRMTLFVAGLLIASGILTYGIYTWAANSASQESILNELVVGLPFAAVSGILWVRPAAWVPLAALLDCATWVGAFRLALFLAGRVNPYFGMAVGGFVGALGVTVAAGLGCRRLYASRPLLGAAVVGAVAGLPFGLIVGRSSYENAILAVSFPLWQVAVGMWIQRRGTPA